MKVLLWYCLSSQTRQLLIAFQKKYHPGHPLFEAEDEELAISIRPSVESLDEISRLMQKPTKQRLAR